MPTTSYEETVEWLFSKRPLPNRKPGLEKMRVACQALGSPEAAFSAVHVAGTNGKGSVCTKIAKGFELSGVVTGLYTSPHIFSFCERIQINGEPIPQHAVVEGVSFIRKTCPNIEFLSFFEIATLLCFWWFRLMRVEMAILEVGLGGRYDATNVCIPDLCVITSISLDHTALLGTTREAIAAEKAGIIKGGAPTILSPRVPLEVILREPGVSEVVQVDGTWEDFDDENSQIAAVAMRKLKLSEEYIAEAIQCLPPCRFQEVPRENLLARWGFAPSVTILDVGHNPDGIRRLLMKALRAFSGKKLCVLFSVSKDKDVREMVRLLLKECDVLICTQSTSQRAMSAAELAALVRSMGGNALEAPVPTEGFMIALRLATELNLPFLVAGTFAILEQVVSPSDLRKSAKNRYFVK
jgi:dihydrofolate synthase / folylpolyglutamate synthase